MDAAGESRRNESLECKLARYLQMRLLRISDLWIKKMKKEFGKVVPSPTQCCFHPLFVLGVADSSSSWASTNMFRDFEVRGLDAEGEFISRD
jgi:hypothetical protein